MWNSIVTASGMHEWTDSDDLTSLSGRGCGFAKGPCDTRISG